MGGGGTPSSLDRLLKAWGLAFASGKVVLDMRYLTGAGARTLPTLLWLNDNAFDPHDIATARLGSLLMPFAGAFTGKPVEGLSEAVLMKSSAYSQLVDSFAAMTQGEAAIRAFKPSGTEYPLAVRLTGKFKTAFPEGRPKDEDKGEKKAAKASESKPEAAQLKESAGENAVVLVGDSDFINDGAAVQIQEIFGQRIVIPRNGNIAFAQALVDQFAGDPALIKLRGRASAARPFTVIRDMEAKAQQAYLGKIKELEDNLGQTQEKLNALQKGKGQGAGAILSSEQQTELENFRRKAAETRLALKEVRRELRGRLERARARRLRGRDRSHRCAPREARRAEDRAERAAAREPARAPRAPRAEGQDGGRGDADRAEGRQGRLARAPPSRKENPEDFAGGFAFARRGRGDGPLPHRGRRSGDDARGRGAADRGRIQARSVARERSPSGRRREVASAVQGRKATLERDARDRVRRQAVRRVDVTALTAAGGRPCELARLGESCRCGRRPRQGRHRARSCNRHQGRYVRRGFLYAHGRQQGGRQLLRQGRSRRRASQNAHAREGRKGRRQGEERQGVRGTAQEAHRECGAREKARALDLPRREERSGTA